MRKLALLLSLLLVLSAFAACTTAKKPTDGTAEGSAEQTTEKPVEVVYPALDVWDGTIAEGFAAGSGTEADPYLIATGAQLAYLAKSVNEGNAYSGQVIALAADVDLNDREWTPIGNGNAPFDGIFDGKNHSISNLSIENNPVTNVALPDSSESETPIIYSGLFGFGKSLTIKNIFIRSASIVIRNVRETGYSFVGILIGEVRPEKDCQLSDIHISDARITANALDEKTSWPNSLYAGGVIGCFEGLGTTGKAVFDRLESTVSIAYNSPGWNSGKYLGGVCGYLSSQTKLDCTDFASELNVDLADQTEETAYVGAFGYLLNGEYGEINLSNAYSRVTLDRLPESANAIIGYTAQYKTIEKLSEGVFDLQNLYGCVLPGKDAVGFTEPRLVLYRMDDLGSRGASVTEKSCVACDALPEDHGLDPAVWDLSDLADPRLKCGR